MIANIDYGGIRYVTWVQLQLETAWLGNQNSTVSEDLWWSWKQNKL